MTKILASAPALMDLYDQKKLDLYATMGDYFPTLIGSNKESMKVYDVLNHTAGLQSWIPFYKTTLTGGKYPSLKYSYEE